MSNWVDELLAAAWPQRCALCRERTGRMALCAGCLLDLPWLEQPCPRCGWAAPGCGCADTAGAWPALAALAYEYPVDRLIAGLKFRADRAAARALGELLAVRIAEACAADMPLPDALVPVPLHWWRASRRGFNQAELIARRLGADLGLPVDVQRLRRIRATPPQSRLGSRERARNLAGAFRCDASVRGLSLALVDDVLTTGATAQSAAAACMAAGAARVQIWTVARTPEPKRAAQTCS